MVPLLPSLTRLVTLLPIPSIALLVLGVELVVLLM